MPAAATVWSRSASRCSAPSPGRERSHRADLLAIRLEQESGRGAFVAGLREAREESRAAARVEPCARAGPERPGRPEQEGELGAALAEPPEHGPRRGDPTRSAPH